MAERFFRDLTVTRVRSGGLHSLPELIAALEKYLLQHNREPKPSIWTTQAKDILAKVTRARAKLNRSKRNAHWAARDSFVCPNHSHHPSSPKQGGGKGGSRPARRAYDLQPRVGRME